MLIEYVKLCDRGWLVSGGCWQCRGLGGIIGFRQAISGKRLRELGVCGLGLVSGLSI